MAYLQRRAPHPNNPLGAALQVLGAGLSDWSDKRRELREEEAEEAQSEAAVAVGLEALRGGPMLDGKPLYGPPTAQGEAPGGGDLDRERISAARLRIAREAPKMLSWFDGQVSAEREARQRQKLMPGLQSMVMRGLHEGWIPDEGTAKFMSGMVGQGENPRLVMAMLTQMEGEHEKALDDQQNIARLSELRARARSSDEANSYVEVDEDGVPKNGPNGKPIKGIHAFMGRLNETMRGWSDEEKIEYLSARFSPNPEANAAAKRIERLERQLEAAKLGGVRKERMGLLDAAKYLWQLGQTAESAALLDEARATPEEYQEATGEEPPREEPPVQPEQVAQGAPVEFRGSRHWSEVPIEERQQVVDNIRVLLEQGSSEAEMAAYLQSLDVSVTLEELQAALRGEQPEPKRRQETRGLGGYESAPTTTPAQVIQ